MATPPQGRRRSSAPVRLPAWLPIVSLLVLIALVGVGGFALGHALADDMKPSVTPAVVQPT